MNQINSTLNRACWLFVISIIIILTVSTLIKDGMFMDAMLYTSVSHNLSQGIGSFWFPYFDEHNVAGLPSFHEQPPLVFGIQSIFFKIFGNSQYVERFYTFCTMYLTAYFIYLIWNEIYKHQESIRKMAWLPILLWITIPVAFWSFSNNMHENTMGLFVISSIWMMIRNMGKEKLSLWQWGLTGILIACAFLSKGFPGLFPLGVPFAYWLATKKITSAQMIEYTSILLLVLLITGLGLYNYKDSNESLSMYLIDRAFQRINEVPSVDSRFFIIGRMFSELIPNMIIALIIFLFAQSKKFNFNWKESKNTYLLFFIIGTMGSLPLILTKVQNGFYAVPSLPFFGIGFAILLAPTLLQLLNSIPNHFHKKIWNGSIALLALVSIFCMLQKGRFSRDKELLHDVYLIGKVAPKGVYIETAKASIYENWSLGCYLMRYYNIGLRKSEAPFLITEKNDLPFNISSYNKVPIPTLQYDLYRKME